MITVLIPSPLRPMVGNRHALPADGATVAAALADLTRRFPPLAGALLAAGGGRLQSFVHAFLDGKDIASLRGLDTPLPDGAELLILQAISGG